MEYLNVFNLKTGDNNITCPNKKIKGIYSTVPFSLTWDWNGTKGPIATNINEWEPKEGFNPSLTSSLVVNVASDGILTMRVEYDE